MPRPLDVRMPERPRILVVKVSSLGDVVHNMPLVRPARPRWPGCGIDWVVEEGYVELVRLLPQVRRDDSVRAAAARACPPGRCGASWRPFARALREDTYDAVIETQGLLKTAVVSRIARRHPGAPVIGLANATAGLGLRAGRAAVLRLIQVPLQTHSVRRSRLLYQVPR